MNFISFDLETTGTLSHADHIVEVAAVKFENFKPVDSYQSLIQIQVPMPEQATAVNGITDEMLKGQPPLKEVLPQFVEFCGDSLLLAHNAIFDFQFLVRAIRESHGQAPKGFVLDTCHLSRKTFPGLPNYKLTTLCKHLKISSQKFHRAKEDAMSCGQLFVKILEELPFSHDLKEVIKFSGKAPLKFPKFFTEGQMSLFVS